MLAGVPQHPRMHTTETPGNTGFDIRPQRISRCRRGGSARRRALALDRRRSAPPLSLLRTVGGWALCDADDRPVYEAEGPSARQACLARALALGVLCLRAGEEMCRRTDPG
jgi:hypothetical protein